MLQHEQAKTKYMECKVCGKKFLKQERFDEHMTIHRPMEVFTCNICDKRFSSQLQLAEHQRIAHVRKTAFKCGLCQYETFVKQNFEKHANMHMRYVEKLTSSTFFKCDKCPQSFREKSALDMHTEHMHS
jgi:transcription elongation factor Elf1